MTKNKSNPIHICILGPSGIGKSPLASLFKLPGFEPFRIRPPRNEKDKLVCKSEDEAKTIFEEQGFPEDKWPTVKATDDWFYVGKQWIFFSVRGDKQCLEYKSDKGRHLLDEPKRMEIFAPRLVDILDNKNDCGKALGLSAENLIILCLNPSATSYTGMSGIPNDELKHAIFYGISKRTELQCKPVDVQDILKRVRRLGEEIKAWSSLQNNAFYEFTSWGHFEYRYYQPDGTHDNAIRELITTRRTLLNRLEKEASRNDSVRALLNSNIVLTETDVLTLTDIV